jgi:hypothetical protein|tara:strand:+ start:3888 stop:5279 length:1392 start_codon:yes stop_codon:yes gene_type:complete
MLDIYKQLAAKSEDTEGTAETLANTEAKQLVRTLQTTIEEDREQRETHRSTMTPTGSRVGTRSRSINFEAELHGPESGTVTDSPQWSKFLEASGFRKENLKFHDPSTITSGPLIHGETLTQASSGATGRLIKTTSDGATALYFIDLLTGTWDQVNTVTGSISGGTYTPADVEASHGLVWTPESHELRSMAIGAITGGPFQDGEKITQAGNASFVGYVYGEQATGAASIVYRHTAGAGITTQVITGATSGATATSSAGEVAARIPSLTMAVFEDGTKATAVGCRGRASLNLESGKAGTLGFEFMGRDTGVVDLAMLTGIDEERIDGPRFMGATLSLDTFTALLCNGLRINMQGNLVAGESATHDEGIQSYRLTGRSEFNIVLSSDRVQVGTYDFYGKWEADTFIELDALFGTTTGNKFEIYAPACQIEGESPGNRESIATQEITLSLNSPATGLGDDELAIIQY